MRTYVQCDRVDRESVRVGEGGHGRVRGAIGRAHAWSGRAKPASAVQGSPWSVATAEPSNMTDMDVQRGESESQLHRTRPLAAPLGGVRPG